MSKPTIEELLGPKCGAIIEAAGHLAKFQCLVADNDLVGEDINKAMKLLNVNEQILVEGGARV